MYLYNFSMIIHFLTIFPKILESYISESIMKRAQKLGIIKFEFLDIRKFSTNKHKNVDDTPYGGGAGMVMQIEPIHRAVHDVLEKSNVECNNRRIVLLSAKGKRYTQRDAERLAKYEELIFICGRYEGVDERVAKNVADEEISIGDFILTGGELSAMVIADSVVRLIPNVLGNKLSSVYESHNVDGYLEHPHYTKPSVYNGWPVPKVLLSGDHAHIEEWRKLNSKN